jgi:outer membrane protein
MSKKMTAGVLGMLVAMSGAAQASEDWMVRFRAAEVIPDASSAPVAGVDANNSFSPEVDLTYFFTKNIAMEAIAATTRHKVTLNSADLGKVSVLPPTVTLQYHFNPDGDIRPYVGAGVNYTRFYNVKLAAPLDVERNSWGGALQAGVDFMVGKNSYINLDVKKIYLETDVTSAGAYLTTLKLDPVVVGIGYGFRF